MVVVTGNCVYSYSPVVFSGQPQIAAQILLAAFANQYGSTNT